MRRNFITSWACLAFLAVSLPVGAAPARPILAGTIVSINSASSTVVLKMQDGHTKHVHMVKHSHYKRGDREVGAAAFQPGAKVSVRVLGSLSDSPLEVDLLTDWMSSNQYVATTAAAPYETRMGDYPTTSGVGGNNPGMVSGATPEHTIGIMGNGGKIEGPPGATQSPINQGAALTVAAPLITGTPAPGTPGVAGADSAGTPYSAASAAQAMRAQQAQVAAMQQQMQPGSSSMNLGDEEGGPSEMGGPPQMANQMMGTPVQMQAQVVSADMASRILIVRAAGSQVNQSVTLSAEVVTPMFQPGQTVSIQGFSSPQGQITANSVVPIGR